jgi:hypothetical protein
MPENYFAGATDTTNIRLFMYDHRRDSTLGQVFISPVWDHFEWLLDVPRERGCLPTDCAVTAYPNPFNATASVSFTLPLPMRVQLRIFNSLGQLVSTLIDENRAAGSHSVLWDASGVASGVYIYQLKAGSFTDSKKMVLMK